MSPRNRKRFAALLLLWSSSWIPNPALAGWEFGAKGGFDTNISRSIDGGEGSGYLSGYGSYWKGHDGENRLDWTAGMLLQGASYPSLSEVDFASATISGGAVFILRPGWTAALTPFFGGKAVRDSEQSAWSFGGRLDLSQKIRGGFYTGEYYVYTDSRAREDVYSYTEHVFGGFLGMRWTPRVFTEAGYEFSRGDSYLSVPVSTTTSGGGGSGFGRGGGRLSTAFGAEVFKESVVTHAVSFTAGIDWSRSWYSSLNYTYRKWDGDVSSAEGSSGFACIGIRF